MTPARIFLLRVIVGAVVGHQLDAVGAVEDIAAHGGANLVGRVRIQEVVLPGLAVFGRDGPVLAAVGTDDLAAAQDGRPGEPTQGQGAAHVRHGVFAFDAPRVADRGEARLQHLPAHLDGHQRAKGGALSFQAGVGARVTPTAVPGDVRVGVHQTGQNVSLG